MTPSAQNDRKIKKALVSALDNQSDFRESRTWQADTMRKIRHVGPLNNSTPGFFQQFGQNIWRLAPVACLLIIVLTAVVIQTDFIPRESVLAVFDYDMEEMALKQMVGL